MEWCRLVEACRPVAVGCTAVEGNLEADTVVVGSPEAGLEGGTVGLEGGNLEVVLEGGKVVLEGGRVVLEVGNLEGGMGTVVWEGRQPAAQGKGPSLGRGQSEQKGRRCQEGMGW